MSNPQRPALEGVEIISFGSLTKHWGWLMALGIVSIFLGTLGLGAEMGVGLTLLTVMLFGWLLVIAGAFQLASAFSCKGWKGIVSHVLTALLYVLAGVLIVLDPVLASSAFTLIIAGVLIVAGLLRIVTAIQHRSHQGWIWTLLAGLISTVFGGVIIAEWPVSGLWVIGLFVAVDLIFNGWAAVFIALAARRAQKAAEQETGAASVSA